NRLMVAKGSNAAPTRAVKVRPPDHYRQRPSAASRTLSSMHCQRLAPIGFDGSDQVVLDLPFDCFEPLLRTICAILEVLYLFVKLRYPILRSPQLYGEPVRHRHGTLQVSSERCAA